MDTFSEELPDAARYLLDDARLAELKRNARASVADKTWDALCEQLLGYYEEARAGYRSNVVNLFGRDITLPKWAGRRRKSRGA